MPYAPILTFPKLREQFIVDTASNAEIGGILSPKLKNEGYIISYSSETPKWEMIAYQIRTTGNNKISSALS